MAIGTNAIGKLAIGAVPSAGGGGLSTNLVIQDATHGHTADSLGLSTDWLLLIQDAAHAHTADNLGLSTDVLLVIAEALHGHAADNVTLDTSNATNLTIQDALHGHIANTLGLTLDTWLAIADAIHAHLADNVALTSEETLAIADALHNHYADVCVLNPVVPGVCPTAEDVAAAVWAHVNAVLLMKMQRNKQITDPVAGTHTIYDDDDVTPLLSADLFEDAAGAQPYRGRGAERREKLI